MNERQKHVMELLRADPRRDLYEGAHPNNTKVGSGEYYVTYRGNHSPPTLTAAEVSDLLRRGLICHKWPNRLDLAMYRPTSAHSGTAL